MQIKTSRPSNQRKDPNRKIPYSVMLILKTNNPLILPWQNISNKSLPRPYKHKLNTSEFTSS